MVKMCGRRRKRDVALMRRASEILAMRLSIKILSSCGIVAIAAGIAAYAWRGEIAVAMMQRKIARTFAADPIADLPDGLHVGLCGAGSPFPDATRAGPCVAVVAGRRLFVIDAGDGSARNLQLMGLAPGQIEAVFLTHFHSDHIDGLGSLMLQRWGGAARQTALPIYGPTGVDAVVAGFNAAYALDEGYRVAHHGPIVMPPSGFGGVAKAFASPAANGPDVTLIDDGGLTVRAFPVDHRPVEPAVGYAFTYKGRKLVVSGDTVASARVEAEAKDADVLVHEALSPRLVGMLQKAAHDAGRTNLESVFRDILTYHTTPEQAAGIAQRAAVGYLLLDHIVPSLPLEALEGPFLGQARTIYAGPLKVGRDGDFISMPAGSKTEIVSNRLR
jgi:ribonuclease Z